MTQLTETQRTVLAAAGADVSGLVLDDSVDRRAMNALIKRGFCISVPKADAPSLLIVTEAGRAALSADPAAATPPEPAPPAPRMPTGKLGEIIALLRRPQGAAINDLVEATGWQAHSVRGAMSGALKKKLGLAVSSEKTETGRNLPHHCGRRSMSGQDLQQALSAEIAFIGAMSLEELRQAWQVKLGTLPPKLRSVDLLARALAHELQVKALGDLPAPLRRRANELARRFAEDPAFRPVLGPVLKPGSSLIREWRGERHEVRVLEDGFSYRGEHLRSLSEAALKITGTKWNGLIFFGLKDRPSARNRP